MREREGEEREVRMEVRRANFIQKKKKSEKVGCVRKCRQIKMVKHETLRLAFCKYCPSIQSYDDKNQT